MRSSSSAAPGLIGSKTVAILRQGDHESSRLDKYRRHSITGEGLKEAMAGTQVVIDSQFALIEEKAVLEFFETSGRTFSRAEAAAGVRHHVATIHRRTDRRPTMLFRAKGRPRETDRGLRHPLTPIIRSTQFLEFLGGIAASSADGAWSGFRRPVPAHRGGRRCCHRRRCGARGDRETASRDRGRNEAPFNEIVARYLRRSATRVWSCVTRGPILGGRVEERSLVRRLAKRASAASVRRMAPPLTGKSRESCIRQPKDEGSMKRILTGRKRGTT